MTDEKVKMAVCETCGGTGAVNPHGNPIESRCPQCKGTGESDVPEAKEKGKDLYAEMQKGRDKKAAAPKDGKSEKSEKKDW